MRDGKSKSAANSTGYKILQAVHIPHSPYQYAPKSQKNFDTAAAKKLAEKYSAESVQQVIQDLSPSGYENKNYGKEIMKEVRAYGR